MVEIELEEFLEEVKFQMTNYEELDKDTILRWEKNVRKWIENHKKRNIIKAKDDIILKIKDEDVMFDMAKQYHKAFILNKEDNYWTRFDIK